MIIEDFVMLGTTVPEPNSDNRIFVCSAGVSVEYRKLLRIYPLAIRDAPRRWAMHRVRVERNARDSRDESFQVYGDRTPDAHRRINNRFELVKNQYPENARANLLSRYVIGSIREANHKRLSLAIIHPEEMELNLEPNPPSVESTQMTLFDTGDTDTVGGARRFPWMPRLKFRDECGQHNLMLRDWGAFEFQRKHDEAYFLENLEGALHLTSSSSLLVGNMSNQRNAWLVISVLNQVREPETLFDVMSPDPVPISAKEKARIYERDDWRCAKCGSDEDVSVRPRSSKDTEIGAAHGEGLQTLCRHCAMNK